MFSFYHEPFAAKTSGDFNVKKWRKPEYRAAFVSGAVEDRPPADDAGPAPAADPSDDPPESADDKYRREVFGE